VGQVIGLKGISFSNQLTGKIRFVEKLEFLIINQVKSGPCYRIERYKFFKPTLRVFEIFVRVPGINSRTKKSEFSKNLDFLAQSIRLIPKSVVLTGGMRYSQKSGPCYRIERYKFFKPTLRVFEIFVRVPGINSRTKKSEFSKNLDFLAQSIRLIPKSVVLTGGMRSSQKSGPCYQIERYKFFKPTNQSLRKSFGKNRISLYQTRGLS
jgi:hypothetical protein